ncbi:MAG: response regulator transcription factor [Fimbriimonadaceae bacterium]|nr:response regulator transcription factor [Chitinophagales bacterium]
MQYAQQNIKILYVEDDPNLGFVTKDNLERKGLKIMMCTDGETAYETFQKNTFNLCILDVMLPKIDGFTLAQKIRNTNKNIPIIFLSAKSMVEDRLEGFKAGADDYIIKPYSIDELLMKVDIFLKRSVNNTENKQDGEDGIFIIGTYEFNFNDLNLKKENIITNLTLREAELLRIFCQYKNKVVKREVIIEQVWKNEQTYIGRSIDVFVSKLRKYLADDPSIILETVRGYGYKLSIENS